MSARSTTTAVLALALLPPLLNACGGGARAQAEQLSAACRRSTNLDQAVCDCMADKATRELSENERGFVIAALSGDQAEADRARGKLDMEGAMKAGMFMTNVGSCANEESGSTE
ncbi:MAG: hypothetical protein AB7R55_09165 [Gemmatimonadales bacterium]